MERLGVCETGKCPGTVRAVELRQIRKGVAKKRPGDTVTAQSKVRCDLSTKVVRLS